MDGLLIGGILSDKVRVFLMVAETKSFRLASQRLKLGQSTVSRQIAELEQTLGIRLFQRSTRAVLLTEAGEALQVKCRAIAADLSETEQSLRGLSGEPGGNLIIHLPAAFGRLHVAPLIPEFLTRHPSITVDVVLSDNYVDFSEARVDAAIRIGRLTQTNLIARKLCDNIRVLVASPDYLRRHGAPSHPHDLVNHACLEFMPLRTASTWQFEGPDNEQLSVKISSRLKADNAEVLLCAALSGTGVASLARFLCADALRLGNLVELLPEWRFTSSAIHVVYPDRVMLPAKTRSFVDFIVEKFRGEPFWERRT
jgi:DNA-binding transcriptional LysR family regulator